ncbi:MAG: lipid-A-disaccharide synthase N-terminal domain-containing protein [Parachlamydiaceae bacterium]
MESLYFIGYFSAFVFSFRFLIQWIISEKENKSVVPISFWWLSLLGNVSLMLHSLIQWQYPVALIQSLNGVISARNINLSSKKPLRIGWVYFSLLFAAVSVTLYFLFFASEWSRIPTHAFQTDINKSVPLPLHIIGALGVFLFNIRFIVQWWQSERLKRSTLSPAFWYLSIFGGVLSLIYFVLISDMVNLIGPLFGLVPYVRNLMLLKRATA